MNSVCNISYPLPPWDAFEKMVDGIWEREYYTNHGPLAIELELYLQKHLGVKNAICMTNSSIALMISVLAFQLKGNAIIPALSHINVAQSVKWAGLNTIVCDTKPGHPTLFANKLNKVMNDDSKLIIANNAFGYACDIEELEAIAAGRGMKLIFLSESVFGQKYKGKFFGGFGDLEIFSFHQSQLVNGADGACITTDDDDLAARLKNIRSSYGAGKIVPIPYTGNGRMSEIQAGLALLSLNDLSQRIAENKKRFCYGLKKTIILFA